MFDWESAPELNITPLVDVMLVLLAVLMIIFPTLLYEEMIRLPHGSHQQQILNKGPIEISYSLHQELRLNGKVLPLDQLKLALEQLYKRDQAVRISADERLAYGDIMKLMNIAKEVGYHNIALSTL